MNKSIISLGLATLLAASSSIQADTILGLYLGGGVWQTDLTGSIGDNGMPQANLSDLGLSDTSNSFFYAALEHPIPIIPNIRLQMVDITLANTGTISQPFVLGDIVFPPGANVKTDLDVSYTDATLYYEILDNVVSLDLGLNYRMFDGYIDVQETSNPNLRTRQTFDEGLPTLYAKAQIALPLGFYLVGTGNGISYSGSSITDIELGAGYMTDGWVMDIGVEVGYKTLDIKVDDAAGIDANIKLDGFYGSANIHF